MIDGCEHSVECVRIVVGFLLEKHGQSEARKFGGEDRAHVMGHIHLAASDLLERVGNRGDFHVAEAVEQRSVIRSRRIYLMGASHGWPYGEADDRNDKTAERDSLNDSAKMCRTKLWHHRDSPAARVAG